MDAAETHAPVNELGIQYLDQRSDKSGAEECVLCGSSANSLLRVPAVKTADPLTYLKCDACGTVFLPKGVRHANFYHQISESGGVSEPIFLKHYLEIGAGPDFMARVLSDELAESVKSFCSVGCGSGLDLDIVARLSDGRISVVGFEPNPYGHVDDLNVKIEPSILDDAWLERTGRRFDLVFASEVIEHVPDPLAFSVTMKNAISSHLGRFVLTTPNAKIISSENRQGDVYAALFPGEHKIIFTAESLRDVLSKAGFSQVTVHESPHRLTAVASNDLVERGRRSSDDPFMHYLQSFISATPADSRSSLMAGNSYRYFAELVNQDRISEALNLVRRVVALRELCDFDGDMPVINHAVAQSQLSASSFEDHVQHNRAFLGPFSYYVAMLASRSGRDSIAADGFKAAYRMLLTDERIAPFYFQVSCALLDPCRFELSQALMRVNRVSELLEMAAEGSLAIVPDGLVGQRVLRAFVDVANRGQQQEARTLLAFIDERGICPQSVSLRKVWFSGRRNRRAFRESAILKFDYCVTRAYHEINQGGAAQSARSRFFEALSVGILIPSGERVRTLRKLASSVLW